MMISRRLELASAFHAGTLVVMASWCFGGNISWAQTALILSGAPGLLITFLEFKRRRDTGGSLVPFLWLWPLVVFAVLVSASTLQPSLRPQVIEGATVLVPREVNSVLPSSAQPTQSCRALALFGALFIPSFNLAAAVRSRRVLRTLLWAVAINTVVLAIFGSLQKLLHAQGLFFGAVHSPNDRFFASFIYQNHWGAFALLSLTLTCGLLFTPTRGSRFRSFIQSPAFFGVVGALFIAASIPLSASRSCSLLAAMVSVVALVHVFRVLSREQVSGGIRGVLIMSVLLGGFAAFQLARPVMQKRLEDTRAQLHQMRESGSLGAREKLYHDTWEMAKDRLIFGWGLASYPMIFSQYNRQVSVDGLPVYYEDAHSDWLQSVAETGVVGTLCRALLLFLPLWSIRRAGPISPVTMYPLGGCVLVFLYAAIEFPFGNPAVVLLFWLLWFSSIRLAQLEARERTA